MFTPLKILVLVLLIVIGWMGFSYIKRVEANRRRKIREAERAPARNGAKNGAKDGPGRSGPVEEMVRCPACGDYVSTKTEKCGRADCPY